MTPDYALSLAQEAVKTALLVGAPILGLGLAVGLLVSLFQATTQINEAALQFVPKVLASLLGAVLFGSWMLTTLIDFTRYLITLMPHMAR